MYDFVEEPVVQPAPQPVVVEVPEAVVPDTGDAVDTMDADEQDDTPVVGFSDFEVETAVGVFVDPLDIGGDIGGDTVVVADTTSYSRYWIRLKDTWIDEIEDIPVDFPETMLGSNRDEFNRLFVQEWTHSVAACDCIRGMRFYQVRGKAPPSNLKCGHKRMRLMGIWDDRGEQIFDGE